MSSLLQINPTLAIEWHPTKNGSLRPADLTTGSNKMVWWIRECTDMHRIFDDPDFPPSTNRRVY